ncbi:Nop53 (60S ribosomal biogenesis) [Rhizoctonia solani]|uniref:Ribosome biogenesis protein NOP53 n=1 Tax=Rhizoctonia solani TaxID=456999 RepID=A0A8H7I697_9AGAM|nr:Nop53 (60S ribosomal biogenesis) [Rhizoctonia solani]
MSGYDSLTQCSELVLSIVHSPKPLARKRAMAISTVNRIKSRYGAPSQPSQSTRKGKKAWRKNVDIEDVEDRLEGLRDENGKQGQLPLNHPALSLISNLYSGPVHEKSNTELFAVDVRGDEQQTDAKASSLKYMELLARRSAVPAVHSVSLSQPHIRILEAPHTREAAEKARLLRIAHRTKNPLEAIQGRSNLPASEAVKRSGKYDVWASEDPDEVSLMHAMRTSEAKEYLLPIVKSHKSRAPPSAPPSVPPLTNAILPKAVIYPDAGTSYNPTYEEHQELLQAAHEREVKRVENTEKAEEVRRRMEAAWERKGENMVEGMIVDVGEENEEDAPEEERVDPVKPPQRKTAQQRRKAARVLAEKRSRASLAQKRQQLASLSTLKSLRRTVANAQSESQKAAAERAEKKAC